MLKVYFLFFVLSSLWVQSGEKLAIFQEWEIVKYYMADTPGTLTEAEMKTLVTRNVILKEKYILVPYIQLLGKKTEELYKKYRNVSFEFNDIDLKGIQDEFGIDPKKLNLAEHSKAKYISVFDKDKNQILSLLSDGIKAWIVFEDSSTLFELKKVK